MNASRVVLVSLSLVCSIASAQSIAIFDDGACPSRVDVVNALSSLRKDLHLVDTRADLNVTIVDLGARYRVSIEGDRVVDDSPRNCAERARASALVVALAADAWTPPPLPVPPPPPPPPPVRPGAWALIDRPLVLPRAWATLKDELTLGLTQSNQGGPVDPGFVDVIDTDVGIGRSVQLGGWLALPLGVHPSVSVVPRITVGLHRDVALRVEVGFDRARDFEFDSKTASGATRYLNGVFAALALVTRVRVHRRLALTFGDTGQRTEWPTQSLGQYDAAIAWTSHALVAVQANGANRYLSVCLPLGVLYQPHRMVALLLQAGPRITVLDLNTGDHVLSVPTSLDIVVTPHPRVDLGATLDAPLFLPTVGQSFLLGFFVRGRI